MITVKTTEHIKIYGCDVTYYVNEGVYRFFVGDKAGTIIETKTESDMAYYINQIQALI